LVGLQDYRTTGLQDYRTTDYGLRDYAKGSGFRDREVAGSRVQISGDQ